MTVVCYPADETGCGKHRVIWPMQVLAAAGVDVRIEERGKRTLRMHTDENGAINKVELPEDADVLVLQRPAHHVLCRAVPLIRSMGVSVVVDVDDDLRNIHPENVAYRYLHPDRHRLELGDQGWSGTRAKAYAERLTQSRPYLHNWNNLDLACREASLVTVSTPRLLRHYAAHGRGVVIPNYLGEAYYGHERVDSADLGWPASIWSHPNDPAAVGSAVRRILAQTGGQLTCFGDMTLDPPSVPREVHVSERFGLARKQVRNGGQAELEQWPALIAKLGIAVVPLADSTFNQSKSWLKGEECAAVGVPFVASPRAEYRRLHQLGAGVLAASSGDWYAALRTLTRSPAYRQELSEAGRAVAETLRLRDNAWRWAEAWDQARANDRVRV